MAADKQRDANQAATHISPTPSEWLSLSDAVEHIARHIGHDDDPRGILCILQVLLREGSISGRRRGRNKIFPAEWIEAEVRGDGTATLVDGFDAAQRRISSQYDIDLRRDDILQFWPDEEDVNSHPIDASQNQASCNTGLQGRPTSRQLIEAQCRFRWSIGERHQINGVENILEWARVLVEWLKDNHPQSPPAGQSAATNILRPLIRELEEKERNRLKTLSKKKNDN